MPSSAFVTADFKVFDVKGFQPRMSEIRSRIRPKLEALGRSLAPTVSRSLGTEVFAHVAKHARRTVNPPDDTWVAFSPDARGYKKHCHFKVAVSRHRSEEHTSELQSHSDLVCRLLLEKKKTTGTGPRRTQ